MAGLSQALIISATGVVMIILVVMCLGSVVDYFTWFGTTVEIVNPVLRHCMDEIMVFSKWFYYLCFYIGLTFVVYPFIWLVRINQYEDVIPANMLEQYQ